MKARFFKKISLGLVLSALPFLGGCNQQTADAPDSIITAAQAEPFIAPDTSAATLAAGLVVPEATPPPVETSPAPIPAVTAGKTLPPNINPSSPVAEIVKLAQSGVDESVMLTYVTNATRTFNLSSDEIIYLNDIGAPSSVITAMLQRDQVLKQSWTDAALAQNAMTQTNAPETQGAAPSYANPPPPESQPVQTSDATASVEPPPANVTYNYFYDSLAPYGSWVYVDGYGSCWRPTVVVANSGWRPYCDGGRWIYTDCGWYWYSDYTWGWAPFHYGRWFCDTRLGWCWYPGYTWGPAWVNWRYSSGYCGWAPLPPAACYTSGIGFTYYGGSVGLSFGFGLAPSCYTFVPWKNFCGYRPYRYCASPKQTQQIYQNSTVINNYVSGNNNTVINQGIPVDRVRHNSGAEIRQVSIRDARTAADRTARGERLERDGRTLVVRRPNIPQSAISAAASPRLLHDSQPGHMPTAGAGAAAQIESSRGRGFDRNPVQSPAIVGGNRATLRGVEEGGGSPSRELPRGDSRPSPAAPFVARGEDRVNATSPATPPTTVSGMSASSVRRATTSRTASAQNPPPGSFVMFGTRSSQPVANGNSDNNQRSTPTTATVQRPPAGSFIMIGRRDSNLNREGNSGGDRRAASMRTESLPRTTYNNRLATQPSTVVAQAETPQASVSYIRPSPSVSRYQRYESPRQVAQPRSAAVPAAPMQRALPNVPAYSAPRATPAPAYAAPNYSAPRPSPAPSYTPAPAQQRSLSVRSQPVQNGPSRRSPN